MKDIYKEKEEKRKIRQERKKEIIRLERVRKMKRKKTR